jgi:hypothetical protein
VPSYQKTVTLRGNTANPGRFAWHEGMRISELIPDKDSLLTRNYWWRRTQLGLPAPEFEPVPGFSNLRQPLDEHALSVQQAAVQAAAQQAAAQRQAAGGVNQPGIATGQAGVGQAPYGYGSQYPYGSQQDQTGVQQYPYGAQQYPYGAQQDQYSAQQGLYGVQQGPTGALQNPDLSAQQRSGSTPLAGQENAASTQAALTAQRTDVRLTAPEIDWDYAVVERVDPETLKTKLLPFDLGKLVLQRDASQDLALQPGDIVSIFSQADIRVPVAEQTKLVRLEGEFVHAGVYSAQPGETLRHLVERAGGLTPNAYLYGSEFTRLSTRVVQQARIDEYVQTLALNIQRGTIQLASSSTASAQTLASSAAAQTSEQNLLAALRQIRATGRIVLSLQPTSTGLDSVPDMALEDGDRFVVPHMPATINVVGSVYNQNSFLFEPGSRAGRYMHLAGGANKDADAKHEFIIRADGEVETRSMSNGPFGNEFTNLRIYPGDTVVIPEKTFKPSALYGIMNWSQVFSQLALGAASLSVINQ